MRKHERSLAFRTLYCWGKIVGLNPLNLTASNEIEFSYYGLVYGFFLAAAYSYIFYIVFDDRLKSSMAYETPVAVIVFFAWITVQFLETLLTWLVFAVRQNRIKLIVARSFEAGCIARELGIYRDYEKDFGQLGAYVALTNFLYVMILTVTLRELSRCSNFHLTLWLMYDLPRIVAFNMEVLFAWSLDVVNDTFYGLNEKLRILMDKEYLDGSYRCRKREPLSRSYRLADRITMIAELHRRLRDLVCHIERHFALLIFLCIASHFAHIALNFYLIYRYAESHRPIGGMDFLFMLPLGVWLLVSVLVLAVISNVCGSTSNEANNTGNILHAIQNDRKILNSEENAKFNVLSLDLLKNRVTVSIFDFFQLNYFFVFSAIATAGTYLVIMLQF